MLRQTNINCRLEGILYDFYSLSEKNKIVMNFYNVTKYICFYNVTKYICFYIVTKYICFYNVTNTFVFLTTRGNTSLKSNFT